jgi:hypothetical protein
MYERNSPEWWAERLVAKLKQRRERVLRLERYYDGKHELAFATSRFREVFGWMLRSIHDNWCPLVVSAVEERLNVEGFRIGDSREADSAAWDIWQRNQLDVQSQIAHTEALKLGDAAVIVWTDENERPVITVEHPDHVCVEFDPANRNRRLAAVKWWKDEVDGECATVYLPDGIYKLKRQRGGRGRKAGGWVRREVEGEAWPIPNPWNVVTVVPLVNMPSLRSQNGVSEFEVILPKQDMANKLLADMMVAAEFSAFRQRWATGIEAEVEVDAEGKAVEVNTLQSAVDRMFTTENEAAKFGEFSQTDLSNYVKAIEMLVQHIASQTATPPHYLLNTGVLPSGESLRAAEAPLVAKARRRQRTFGGAWEEVMRVAFLVSGDQRLGEGVVIETIWSDPENRTESEHIDAITKLKALNVPDEVLWEKTGAFTQAEIDRFRGLAAETALLAALAEPATAPTPAPDAGPVPMTV